MSGQSGNHNEDQGGQVTTMIIRVIKRPAQWSGWPGDRTQSGQSGYRNNVRIIRNSTKGSRRLDNFLIFFHIVANT